MPKHYYDHTPDHAFTTEGNVINILSTEFGKKMIGPVKPHDVENVVSIDPERTDLPTVIETVRVLRALGRHSLLDRYNGRGHRDRMLGLQ